MSAEIFTKHAKCWVTIDNLYYHQHTWQYERKDEVYLVYQHYRIPQNVKQCVCVIQIMKYSLGSCCLPKGMDSVLHNTRLFVLRFYGPVNPLVSCRAWSVYLTTLLRGRLSPLSSLPVCVHSFARNWQLLFLNQWKGGNDHRKYFMIQSPWKNVANLAGVEPATSWAPVGRASN